MRKPNLYMEIPVYNLEPHIGLHHKKWGQQIKGGGSPPSIPPS